MNNQNTIINEELKVIAPNLAKIQRTNPFSVPVHYFEASSAQLLEKVKAAGELSVLESLKKENPFEVPYNYFESLPNKILNRVREEEKKTNWVDEVLSKLSFLLKPRFATASIIVVIGLIFFINRFNHQAVNTPTLAAIEKQVTTQDVDDYINTNIDQFDERTIAANLSNTQLDNAPFPIKSIDSLNIDLSQIDDNTIKEIAM